MSEETTSVMDTTSRPAPMPGAPAPPPPGTTVSSGALDPNRRRSGAVWWGIVLVFLGVALLVGQFLPGVRLWQWWPLIVIALGVRAAFGPSGRAWSIRYLADGLVTVTIGLVLLGQMTGYLHWNVWLNILRLWPLLLVSIGVEVIGKGLRSDWIRALGSLVVIGGMAYGALVMTPTTAWPVSIIPAGESTAFDFSAPHEIGVEAGVARIDGGVGRLNVQAGTALATATGRSPFEPVFEAGSSEGEASVRISPGSGSWGPGSGDTELDVALDENVVWNLDVNAGVTQPELDLSSLRVGALKLDAGVSDGSLTLGPASAAGTDGPVRAKIEAGVSSLTIRVPAGDDVRISVGMGLTDLKVRGSWTNSRDGDRRIFESEGFSDSGAYWDIDIRAGISSITVDYY